MVQIFPRIVTSFDVSIDKNRCVKAGNGSCITVTIFLKNFDCGPVGSISAKLLRYCRNVRPTWVKFDSKDTKESVFEVLSTKSKERT